ncbi:group-specific protein [Bacillus massilinigeriensis]|uniref:group-specific protein n=1 Tax=Bacillus mediterraneensis TaxID=1805474 RepID=UPI0008F7F662|nr:group-specific protein [Bacillus mediterraneensis]
MSECKMDHSVDDVKKKFAEQKDNLPLDLHPLFQQFLMEEHTQDILNEVFHLLKKYDLASEVERSERNKRLYMVVKNV